MAPAQRSSKLLPKAADKRAPKRAPKTATQLPRRSDMILAMNDPYMQQIIDGTKTYEFRKYNMAGIQRIWFYRTAPHSAITHICRVNQAVTRNNGDEPLTEDGLGNKEYNEKDPDYEGYDYAYRINEVYEINAEGGNGITWAMMKDEHGMKIPPRGRVTVPESMIAKYHLKDQKKIL
jgi:predicted transcriptional regulator